jgi:hypothetical protein
LRELPARLLLRLARRLTFISNTENTNTAIAAASMDIINIIDDDAEDEEEYQELPDVLVGSGAYQIVGIRYYTGVAHPGEFVNLIREPNNRE